jgi:glycerol-3-phosphate dehydrogenase (NAD(P)+)
MNVAIVGAGAWGTALGIVLSQKGHPVTVWGHNPQHLAETARQRENRRYLPGVSLPDDWQFEAELASAVVAADALVLAVPSKALAATVTRLAGFSGPVISTTKGIEAGTGHTMGSVIAAAIPAAQVAVLSGPTLAAEVARGIPTAVVAAAHEADLAKQVQSLFHRPAFRVYRSDDLPGVELGGALKNVIAIAAGVCDGLGFGDNSKAALITRGLAEITRLGVACGARAETFAGLSGVGDLTVTCFSKLSRNRAFGERLGRGETVETILAHTQSAVEGHPTAASALELARRLEVPCPIITEVHAMLHAGKNPRQAVADLLSRDSRAEG